MADHPPSTSATLPDAVTPTNPYSRLMALQRMGVVPNYAAIRTKTVAIVGVGGVGAVAAEMLTRCGLGRLLLFDCDSVEPANLNRLFFTPSQCGMTKVDAAAQTLAAINPDCVVEAFHSDITTLSGCAGFKAALCGGNGDTTPSRVDLILSCVDNYAARMTVNAVALELNQPWLESGVSEDAVSGHVQWLEPGATACFGCAPPLALADDAHHERTIVREGVCAASLPTTMGVVAGLLVQAALKKLLGFGRVSGFLGYSALSDHFPTFDLRPNPECGVSGCAEAQRRVAAEQAAAAEAGTASEPAATTATAAATPADENEWGIEVVGGAGEGGAAPPPAQPPAAAQTPATGEVDDLMAQLAALGG